MNFFEETNLDKEYNYKILLYPNITYSQDLEKDSYIVVASNIIKYFRTVRPDIYWYALVPDYVKSFEYDNVNQIIYNLPSYPNSMRCHFDVFKFLKIINYEENDFDIIYNHLPEHNSQITNVIYNNTNLTPEIIGYCHWYEVSENTNYDKTMFLNNINGTLEMSECGVNSNWLKHLILNKCKAYYSDNIISKLNNIIQPHYLGVDSVDIDNKNIIDKSIIFNHRDDAYTGWSKFIVDMDKLYEKRKDFTVYTTLADIDKPYIKKMNLNSRNEYLNFLKRMQVGVGCFDKYSAWSISTTDGLSRGVPYILPDKLCYNEMFENNYPLLFDNSEDFLTKIEQCLDKKNIYDISKIYIENHIKDFLWSNRISKWFNKWDILNIKSGNITDGYNKIKKFIKSKNIVTKKQILQYMNWGVRIKFQQYRNLLRNDPDIKLTIKGYEYKK
jgi:hypothetical protein